nr:protein WIR1B-like isoform X1 [Lolium perenne]
MRTQRNGLSFRALLVMAFMLIAAFQAVSVQGGRAMKEVVGSEAITANPLNPGSTPAVPRGQPYTRPGCTKTYGCNPPAAP